MSVYVDIPQLGGSPYWSDPVASFGDLPTGQFIGEIRVTVDTMNGYYWDGSAWQRAWAEGAVGGPDSSVDGEIALFDGVTGRLVRSAAGTGFVRTTAGVYTTQASIDLAADVSGVLPVANGGTGSSTFMNNNRIIRSSGGNIVEAAAITGSRAVVSSATGIPTHSTVTTTELEYVSGVTSAIQTQFADVATSIATKEPAITAAAASTYWRGDKTFQTLNSAALISVADGTPAATGAIGEVLTATTASNTTTGVGASGDFGSAVALALTAGSWVVEGRAGFNENGATLTTGLQVGVSTSATGSGLSEFDTQLAPYLISASSDAILSAPGIVVETTGTTCYLNTKFWYTAGTPRHRGYLIARRIR